MSRQKGCFLIRVWPNRLIASHGCVERRQCVCKRQMFVAVLVELIRDLCR